MGKACTVYWTPQGWAGLAVGDPVAIAGSNQFVTRGVVSGDDLYFVNLQHGEVRLLGAMTVGEVITHADAKRRFGDDIWNSNEFAVAAPGTASSFAFRTIPQEVVAQLRFISNGQEVGVRLNRNNDTSEQTLRGIRVLTDNSADLLETLLGEGIGVTVPQFEDALVRLWPAMSEKRRQMLRAHCDSSGHALSMRRLAEAAGYVGWRPANLQYGAVGHEIARITGFPTEESVAVGLSDWTNAIGWIQGSAEPRASESVWTMHSELVEAMRNLRSLTGVSEGVRDQEDIEDGDDLGQVSETEREELRKARVGQGRFRDGVVEYWGRCAITGCDQQNLLIASHIVPWKYADNHARLDHFNGLLLTPNLDRLFDLGWISFDNDGRLLRSRNLRRDVARAMELDEGLRIARLDERHRTYLKFHRDCVFQS